jgi:hypothetical protein
VLGTGRWVESRADQGGADLDGDGGRLNVLHRRRPRRGQNLGFAGLAGRWMAPPGAARRRAQDWNGDGDQDDFVFFDWVRAPGSTTRA